EKQVPYLETAVRYAPDDAALRLALAEAHLYRAEEAKRTVGPTVGATASAYRQQVERAAAARQLLAARALCPVMVQPHLKLAALTDQFVSDDGPPIYLRRATLLAPTDAQLWFLRGGSEQKAGDE